MPPIEIPGFYWDEEKQRHFRIQPNHAQNQHTRDAIAKKEEAKAQALQRASSAELLARRIKRSRLPSSAHSLLPTHTLDREIGSTRLTLLSPLATPVQLLSSRYNASYAIPQHLKWVRKYIDVRSWPIVIAHDPRDDSLWTAGNIGDDGYLFNGRLTDHAPTAGPRPRYAFLDEGQPRAFLRRDDDACLTVSTLAVSPKLGLVTAVGCALPDGSTSARLYLEVSEPMLGPFAYMRPACELADTEPPRSLACHPTQERAAMACGGKLYTVSAVCGCTWSTEQQQPRQQNGSGGREEQSEVLATAWLDTDILIAGCRDGSVTARDLRLPATERPIFSLQCGTAGSSVLNLRPLEHRSGYQLLVQGLKSHLALYDLRHAIRSSNASNSPALSSPDPPPQSPSRYQSRLPRPTPGRRRPLSSSSTSPTAPTTPLITYPYSNLHSPTLGFACSPALDLIAIGTDTHPALSLLSLSTGKPLPLPEPHTAVPRPWTSDPCAIPHPAALPDRHPALRRRTRSGAGYGGFSAEDGGGGEGDWDSEWRAEVESGGAREREREWRRDARGIEGTRVEGPAERVSSIAIWENGGVGDGPVVAYGKGKEICVLEWG